jgi:putative ABC transport system permease protein
MDVIELLDGALRSLLRNKMRSLLTSLGMTIGIGAVIAMVVIGHGARARVEQAFAAMGENVLIITSGTTKFGGAKGGAGTLPTLTFADLAAIREELPSVKAAAPQLKITAPVLSAEQNWTTQVNGTSPEYFEIRSWAASSGSCFDAADVDGAHKVAVIGRTVVEKLFGSADANVVGKTIRVRDVPLQIVGVLEKKGQSPSGFDFDDQLFVPVSTYQRQIAGGMHAYLKGAIVLSATATAGTALAQSDLESLLRERHHLAPEVEPDFLIKNLDEIARAKEESTETLTTFLAGVAAVSLLVGGIGIMNIMLVSVTERTREIGLRMALGARPRDILAQFLVEALALAAIGGLLGVALGLIGAERLASRFEWPIKIEPLVPCIAVGFSALVGIVFGVYPARKASRLDPIEALRYE